VFSGWIAQVNTRHRFNKTSADRTIWHSVSVFGEGLGSEESSETSFIPKRPQHKASKPQKSLRKASEKPQKSLRKASEKPQKKPPNKARSLSELFLERLARRPQSRSVAEHHATKLMRSMSSGSRQGRLRCARPPRARVSQLLCVGRSCHVMNILGSTLAHRPDAGA